MLQSYISSEKKSNKPSKSYILVAFSDIVILDIDFTNVAVFVKKALYITVIELQTTANHFCCENLNARSQI